jgi:hypothetical protein
VAMSDPNTRPWLAAAIQRRLRVDEALIEMVRAERVFLASRGHSEIPGEPGAIRRLVDRGLKAKSKP